MKNIASSHFGELCSCLCFIIQKKKNRAKEETLRQAAFRACAPTKTFSNWRLKTAEVLENDKEARFCRKPKKLTRDATCQHGNIFFLESFPLCASLPRTSFSASSPATLTSRPPPLKPINLISSPPLGLPVRQRQTHNELTYSLEIKRFKIKNNASCMQIK